MRIDPNVLSPKESYLTMIACVIPRPIAWVLTLNAEGGRNLAPFSFFAGVTTHPMTVMVSVGRRSSGARKDTAENLLTTREAVVHIPPSALQQEMVMTSRDDGPDADEVSLTGLLVSPSDVVGPPRLANAPIAMEARLTKHMEMGHGPVDLFFLEVVYLHIEDEIVSDGLPDPAKLNALGRLGGAMYSDTSAPFVIPRG